MLKIKVYAKLNLFLDVLNTQNGFHNLDSLVTSVDIFDTLKISPRSDKNVTINSVFELNSTDNIAYKAAISFLSHFNTVGCNISIEKGIAEAAGLGGSSADAAAVIFALCKLNNIEQNEEVEELCNKLGSDILYMTKGGFARMRGKGDKLKFFTSPKEYHFAVTTFEHKNSTKQIFEQFDFLKNSPKFEIMQKSNCTSLEVQNAVIDGRLSHHHLFNALEPASTTLSDYATNYLNFCQKHQLFPKMTGSGSAYFLLCNDKSHALEISTLLNNNGFKTTPCTSKNCGIEICN